MRVRRGSDTGSLPFDESQVFMLSRLVLYVDRLLAVHSTVNPEILELVHWLLGPEIVEEDLLPLALMLETGEQKRRFQRDLKEEIRHGRDFAHLVDQALCRTRKDE